MNKIVSARTGVGGDGSAAPEWENCKFLKIVVGDGQLRLVTETDSLALGKGRIAAVPPRANHRLEGSGSPAITVLIDKPLLALKSAAVINDVAGGGLQSAAQQAVTFFDSGNAGVLNALGELIVSYLSLALNPGMSPVVESLMRDVEKNANDSAYSVESRIRRLPLNYDYVRKLFKKETGLTPHEYLTAVRMERAGRIILSGVSNRYSALTIGQIAEACGYSEPLYFSRVFKKYFGASPTEYSKRR